MNACWSAQQTDIFNWFKDGQGHLVVRARAGTGKTTTILEGVVHAPEPRILLCAFNKRIQEELQNRLSNPAAQAKTLHSVGYAALRRYWEGLRIATGHTRAFSLADKACGGACPDVIKRLVGTLPTKG